MGRIQRRTVDGILLLDKPLGMSSNQALQIAKRLYRAEKAGHTGSLDPLATGLLPLCFGQATKISGYLLDADKCYCATVKFGERTATGDAEGEVVARSDASTLSREQLLAAAAGFLGPIRQVPPMYSALKRDGEPLYKLARQGIEIEREARDVTISGLDLISFAGGAAELDVRCSKGTYIRTLAEDIARAAGHEAHLIGLRRTGLGAFQQPRMWTIEELEALAGAGVGQSEAALDACLIEPAQALAHWPSVTVDPDLIRYLARGQAVVVTTPAVGGQVTLLDVNGRLLGLGEFLPDGRLAPKRWMASPQ